MLGEAAAVDWCAHLTAVPLHPRRAQPDDGIRGNGVAATRIARQCPSPRRSPVTGSAGRQVGGGIKVKGAL